MRWRQTSIGVFVLVLGVACASTPIHLRQTTSPFVDAWLEWNDAGAPGLRVAVDVPGRELQAAGESGAPDMLVVTAVLIDAAGKRVASEAWRTNLPTPAATAQRPIQQQQVLLPRQPGRHELQLGILLRGRVVVADWRRVFMVPPFPAPRRALSEPVFLTPGSSHPFPARVYDEVATPRLQKTQDFRGSRVCLVFRVAELPDARAVTTRSSRHDSIA